MSIHAVRDVSSFSVFLLLGSVTFGATVHEDAKLLAGDLASWDAFGHCVAVDGDVAVVGAPVQTVATGAVYVFERVGAAWVPAAKLTASDATVSSYFGQSVALDGDTLVVGAWGRDDPLQFAPDEGAAYVFERIGGVWTETQLLTASDATFDDHFGFAVSIDDDTIAVGSPWNSQRRGAAYVFHRELGGFVQKAKLMSPDGAVEDRLGSSVAVSGDALIAGAPHDDDDGTASGVAFAYRRVAGAWLFDAKVKPPGLSPIDQFSFTVALDGDMAAISAPSDDAIAANAGAVYLFERLGSAWTLIDTLRPPGLVAQERFGESVDLAAGLLAIGGYSSDLGANSGAVYLFRPHAGTWTEEHRVVPSDGAASDYFGASVSIGDDVVLVGAVMDDDVAADAGSAYVIGQRFYAHGSGCPGAGGFVPTLDAWGDPTPGGTVQVDLDAALGGAPAFFFLGAAAAAVPMGGGCALNLQPPIGPYGPIVLSGVGPGTGSLHVPFVVPAGFPAATAHLQAFVIDAGAANPSGFAATRGFAVRVE